MTPLVYSAPAKVNLTLEVTGRLPGGYHELDTVFSWLDLEDRLEVREPTVRRHRHDGVQRLDAPEQLSERPDITLGLSPDLPHERCSRSRPDERQRQAQARAARHRRRVRPGRSALAGFDSGALQPRRARG